MLQERLGHPDIQTTFNTYGGLFHGYDEGIACALDDAFIAFNTGHCVCQIRATSRTGTEPSEY